METIWKYELRIVGSQIISMPPDAKILTVQTQSGYPFLWVRLDPDAEKVPRTILVFGTGGDLYDVPMQYIGTFQMQSGALVFHVFEI